MLKQIKRIDRVVAVLLGHVFSFKILTATPEHALLPALNAAARGGITFALRNAPKRDDAFDYVRRLANYRSAINLMELKAAELANYRCACRVCGLTEKGADDKPCVKLRKGTEMLVCGEVSHGHSHVLRFKFRSRHLVSTFHNPVSKRTLLLARSASSRFVRVGLSIRY